MQFSKISRNNERIFQAVSYLLVSTMMACVAITTVFLIQKVSPNFNAAFLPVICFLITLERQFTFKTTKKIPAFSKPWLVWFGSQWVVILLILKIFILLNQDIPSYARLLQLWQIDFFTYFFDLDYLLASIFIVVIWMIAGYIAGLLDEMSLNEMAIVYETAVQAPTDRPPARERLVSLVFAIGIILVAVTALMRINLRMLFNGSFDATGLAPLPYLAAGAWNVLLFFVLGMILLSQSQLSRLNALWSIRKIPIEPQLVGRWVVYSILFVVVLSLIASLLPTHYSLGFLSVFGYLLQLIYFVVFFIFSTLLSAVFFLINFLISLFSGSNETPAAPIATMEPPLPPLVDAVTGATLPWLDVLKSLVFWLVFLAIIGFSLYQYLRQHEEIMQAIRKFPGFSWFVAAWKWLTAGFKDINQRLGDSLRTGIKNIRERRARRDPGSFGRLVNLRRLNPRQRVFFFFLAMTRRGGDRGVPRKESQTPYEYAATLEVAIPDVDEDVKALTDAFVHARYSRHPVDEDQASRVKHYWERIRRAIRKTINRKPENNERL